jgi:NAD(P)-dependent dehydrogenase (short-subunit alcohol dehydrogenase family)
VNAHPFDLSGRIAFVTGAGRGLGEASAIALGRAGADVAVASRSVDELEAVAAQIGQLGRRSTVHPIDIRDVASIQATVAEVEATHGRIDILVNNAGTNVQQPVLDVTEEAWDLVMGTNLKGAFFCAQAVGRGMVERGVGKIINMASTFAQLGFPGRATYAASKGGVVQFTRVMALEWAKHGVNVNAIGPTATRTRMNESLFAQDDYRANVVSRIPAGRFAEPADVAGAVLFLASGASDMVNGHLLLVDGGWSVI